NENPRAATTYAAPKARHFARHFGRPTAPPAARRRPVPPARGRPLSAAMADPLDDDPFDDAFHFDADLDDGSEHTETTHAPSPRAIRLQLERRALKLEREDSLRDVLRELPAAGEQIHLVARNRVDFWTWTPTLIDW